MEFKNFANTGVPVSRIGFGCMGMSAFYAPDTSAEGDVRHLELLEEVYNSGVNFLDTADIYGPELNEKLVGKFLKTKPREKIFLATKFGFQWDESGEFMGVSGQPDYVKSACEASLKRLDTPYIDLYYLHRLDPFTPIEETVAAMAELVKEGKVRYIGLSEVGSEIIRRAHKIHPISAIQSEYSLWTRDVENNGVLATCRELNIAFVAYSPLGRGFLTGTIANRNQLPDSDWRKEVPRFSEENFEKNFALVDKIKEIAKQKNVTAAQVCLAWLLAQGDNIFPIPGTTKEKYLKENNASVHVKLTDEDLKHLNSVLQTTAVSGGRYDEGHLQLLEVAYQGSQS